MQTLFRGRFEIKLDIKGRLSLPAAYRDSFTLPQLVITNSRYQNHSCLHAYTIEEWKKLERQTDRLPSLKAEVQAFQRFYLSAGQVLDIDPQARVSVPQSLRKFAGLESQIVLVGLGRKFEIWAKPTWSAIYETLTENFEDTMSAVALLETEQDKGHSK
jgi:MraZ protein